MGMHYTKGMASSRISPPLWVALAVPLFLVLGLGSAASAFFSIQSGQRNAEAVVGQLSNQVAHRVEAGLLRLMSQPLVLNEVNRNALKSGVLSMTEPASRDRFFAGQLAAYPEVSYTFLGSPDGSFFGARRNDVNAIEVIHNDKTTGGASEYYRIDGRGNPVSRVAVIPNFDCRTRPWYQAAVEASQPVFSAVYRHFVYRDLAVTAASPVYDEQGRLQGVLGVDFRLDRINGALAPLCPVEGGTISIVEAKSGLLVGNSVGLANHKGEGNDFVRLGLADLDHPFLPELATHLSSGGMVETSAGPMDTEVFPFRLENLDWLVLVTLPHQAFTKELDEQVRTTSLLSAITLILSLLVGALVLGRALKALASIDRAAGLLASGQWSTPLPRVGYQELDRLSESFASMSAQLKGSIEGLEGTVTQRTHELTLAIQTKDKFLAIVAHDLLGPVDAMAQLLEEVADDEKCLDTEEVRALHKGLATSSRQVFHLLDNLLQWAQSQRGEIGYHPRPCAVDALVKEATTVLVPKAAAKGIRLSSEVPPGEASCDHEMVCTMIRNLVSNAIKFSRAGSEIRIEVDLRDGQAHIAVRDQGVGMPPEKVATLFDLGLHTKGVGTQGERGTGLGLILCQEFAARHGTRLEVESTVGVGSCFRFSLPLAKPPV